MKTLRVPNRELIQDGVHNILVSVCCECKKVLDDYGTGIETQEQLREVEQSIEVLQDGILLSVMESSGYCDDCLDDYDDAA